MASGQVLVVSADERWLRVLEVTLRLGGADPISRRSAREALNLAAVEAIVSAIVLDLAQAGPDELEIVRGLLGHNSLPAVVILPERLAEQREAFAAAGATVLVRPYRPSELYAALGIAEDSAAGAAETTSTRPEPGAAPPAAPEPGAEPPAAPEPPAAGEQPTRAETVVDET